MDAEEQVERLILLLNLNIQKKREANVEFPTDGEQIWRFLEDNLREVWGLITNRTLRRGQIDNLNDNPSQSSTDSSVGPSHVPANRSQRLPLPDACSAAKTSFVTSPKDIGASQSSQKSVHQNENRLLAMKYSSSTNPIQPSQSGSSIPKVGNDLGTTSHEGQHYTSGTYQMDLGSSEDVQFHGTDADRGGSDSKDQGLPSIDSLALSAPVSATKSHRNQQ